MLVVPLLIRINLVIVFDLLDDMSDVLVDVLFDVRVIFDVLIYLVL